jgi:outer membrane receptor protein involved in Fe transport
LLNHTRNIVFDFGVRLEQTNTNANQLNMIYNSDKNYLDIFPSLYLKQLLTNNSEITFSYSKRINRPSTSMLNPFVNNADPQVLRYGNPDLQPEYVNSFELGYNYYFPVLTVSSSVFYRNINDVMTRYIYADSSGISYFTYKNLAKSDTYGVEIILNGNIFKWLYFNSNLTYLKVSFSGNEGKKNNYDSWVGKVNSSFTLPANFEIQLLFNYQGTTSAAMGVGDQTFFSGGSKVSLAQGLSEPD